jgi:catalase
MVTSSKSLAIAEESIPENEPEMIQELIKLASELLDKKPLHTLRQQHTKSHGCVKAEFIIDQVPENLRHGIFSQPNTYRAWVRFSNGASDPESDQKGDARGMSIKLLGVEGETLLERDKHTGTHDFIMFNFPVFFLKDAKDSIAFCKALLFMKKLPPFAPLKFLGIFVSYLISHPQQANIIKALQRNATDLLQEQYWSTLPYKLGPHAIKFSTRPSAGQTFSSISPSKSDNSLREMLVKRLSEQAAYFDFLVQLQTDPIKMPIEDATIDWKESDSPWIKVATLKIPKQIFDTPERRQFDENLSYNPWHVLPDHRPLGGISRVRKPVYEALSKLRHELNQQPVQEPTIADFDQA